MHELSDSDLELLDVLGFEVSEGDSDQGYITLKKNNKGARKMKYERMRVDIQRFRGVNSPLFL